MAGTAKWKDLGKLLITDSAAPAGGSGIYYYCEVSGGSFGQLFRLEYDGSGCAGSASASVVATVDFQLHMWGSAMGTLSVFALDAAGTDAAWDAPSATMMLLST